MVLSIVVVFVPILLEEITTIEFVGKIVFAVIYVIIMYGGFNI